VASPHAMAMDLRRKMPMRCNREVLHKGACDALVRSPAKLLPVRAVDVRLRCAFLTEQPLQNGSRIKSAERVRR
jgi:hypothetical protein